MLIPVHAWEDKGDFTFQIADSFNVIPSACVASLEYSPKDEFDFENVFLSLNSECAKPLTQLTRQNIGKTAIIFYRGDVLSPGSHYLRSGYHFQNVIKENTESCSPADAK